MMDHIVSGCSKLALKEYKRRHDNLGKLVHWKLTRNCNVEAGDESESVEDYKILRDFSFQTDQIIEARRPDLVVVEKRERSCKIIDFRIEEKEKDKIEKYQNLGRELQKEQEGTAQVQTTVLLGMATILRKILGI